VSEESRADGSAAPPRGGRVRSPQNLVAGLSLAALGAFTLWASADLETGTMRSMGPGMLPRSLAWAVGGAGLLLAALAFLREGAALGRWSWRGPLFLCLGVVAFALTIRTVGLAVAGPLVALIGGSASADARPRELVVFAILVTAFCVGLFRYALHLPIPILILPGIVRI
jgi:putative tricarboxylic transport membrane protein